MPGSRVPNLASLLVDRADRRPDQAFGVAEEPTTLGAAADLAARLAATLADAGIEPGHRVAVVGPTSTDYLVTWVALQLAGAEPALINPAYPDELLAQLVDVLAPVAVVWSGRRPGDGVGAGALQVETTEMSRHRIDVDGVAGELGAAAARPPGLARDRQDVAGYMHTSGTTGLPKLCAQSHEYFLSLGRFIADGFALSADDTVLAPLPMFHVNPLGYGVVGGLTGHAAVLGCRRFSASGFWPTVRRVGATVAILHGPPVEILKRATTAGDATGHRLRAVFYADPELLERFAIPFGVSVYGSTEAAGLTHIRGWRRGERCDSPEGMSRHAGSARPDVEWRVAADGEVQVRGRRPGVLASGYATPDGMRPLVGDDGWFATGDLGREEDGELVFVERAAEAIRVKGEYVPIDHVEDHFGRVEGLDEVALWRRPSDLVDDEVVLYVVGPTLPVEAIRAHAARLAPFLRPSVLVRVEGPLPRDAGVGKVQRRRLGELPILEQVRL